MNQPDLFLPSRDLREEAERWIGDHPVGYLLFQQMAERAMSRGRRFGMKLLAERIRWELKIERGDETFKINNNHIAYIGRRLIQDDPRLARFIELRAVDY